MIHFLTFFLYLQRAFDRRFLLPNYSFLLWEDSRSTLSLLDNSTLTTMLCSIPDLPQQLCIFS